MATSTSGRIDLTWTDNSGNEFEFIIQRSSNGGVSYAQVGVAPANSQAYSDFGLSPNTSYLYEVAAWNSKGYSSWAGPVTATTKNLNWEPPITGGPANGRGDHSAIYDTSTTPPRMIVFGGFDVGTGFTSNELWAFTLPAAIPVNPWTLLSPSGLTVPGLSAHSAVFDSLHQRMIVFGGQIINGSGLTIVNDVYVLDLTTLIWSKPVIGGTPPSPRIFHRAVYDSFNFQMIVFGGSSDGSNELADAYSLNLTSATSFSWSGPLPISGPVHRQQHCAAFDLDRTRMIIFGGIDLDNSDGSSLALDSWGLALDPADSWSQFLFSGTPGFRYGHSGIYDSANQRMLTFGGEEDFATTPTINSETWALNLNGTPSWSILLPAGSGPAGRLSHTAIYDSAQGRMVIYGGYDVNQVPFSDTWVIQM